MFHGLFINLDSRPDRLARITGEFERYGLADRYRRIAATADPQPFRGCFRSHLMALEEAQRMGGIVHILEDDSILSDRLAPFLGSRDIEKLLECYDIVHLDMWIDPDARSVRTYKIGLGAGLLELGKPGGIRLAATSSYIVAPRSMDRIKALWRHHLSTGSRAIDGVSGLLAAAGEIEVAVVLPFLTSVDPECGSVSDVQKMLSRDHQRKLILLRSQFFVGELAKADSA